MLFQSHYLSFHINRVVNSLSGPQLPGSTVEEPHSKRSYTQYTELLSSVCYPGAHAGTYVEAEGLQSLAT